jgi:simple sugar transport system substrate-binding protein
MSEAKPKGLSTSLVVVAVIVTLIIGVVAGYFIKPIPPAEVKTETKTVEKTVTVTPGPPTPEFTFYYVSHGGPGDPWWAPVIKGTQDASKLLGVKTVYLGPEKFSIKALTDMLESAIAAKPDGIILTITAVEPLDEPVRRAVKAGIPVIAVNVEDPREFPEKMPYLGYIGQNEYMAGQGLAQGMLKEFKPKRAVIGNHEVGHVGLAMRAKGISSILTPLGIPVEELDITSDPTKAIEIFRSYLEKYPDTDAIFTLGPLGAHPALKLLEERGLIGKVRLATIDLDEEILKAIEEGKIVCAVSQQPYMQGFLPVVWLYLHKKYGFIPPERMPTGPAIIDKNTLSLIRKQIETTGGA